METGHRVDLVHRGHDELLVIRVASGDADAVDRTAAERQVAACGDCRRLLADVRAIRGATDRAILRVPVRPRSFRISTSELERIREPAWRRWLARFGAPRYDLVRPLATAVAGFGLVVAVLGGVAAPLSTGPFFGAPAAAPMERENDASASGEGVDRGQASPPADHGPGVPQVPLPTGTSEDGGSLEKLDAEEPFPLPIVTLGVVILAAGVFAVVLSTAARRAAGR